MARPPDPHAKDALVTAARAEFARRGLQGARIEDITAACGLSKGAFYLHFRSKEHLFQELVQRFQTDLNEASARHMERTQAFLRTHGALSPLDVSGRSAKFEALLALEADEDLRILETMWQHREVAGVLFDGSRGTEFEGLVWRLVEAEEQRLVADFQRLQGTGVCREDVPAEVMASVLVGTYLLLSQRMSRAPHKPDLAEWARSLHRVLREGTSPVADPRRNRPRKGTSRRPVVSGRSRRRLRTRRNP